MTRRVPRISIPINFDSADAGYASLQTLFPFLLKQIQKGNNMIQTYQPFTTHKTTLCLQSKRVKEWPIHIKWNDIKCKVTSDWLKHSPCDVGNEKIFVKYKSNTHVAGFGLYLLMMMAGEITVEKHKEFVKLMQKTLKNVIIHNEEVDWLHLKEYKNNLIE